MARADPDSPQKLPLVGYALGILVAVLCLATWAATGFHQGWTQTQVPHTVTDEITGISKQSYEDGFIAGVDFLGAGILAALIIVGIAFILQRKH